MSDRRRALHHLIEEAREEDLPLLKELLARFQRPLDFPLQPTNTPRPQSDQERARQELILEAHTHSRWTHLERQHIGNTAKRLGIDGARIQFAAGGASGGAGDAVEMTRHWFEGSALWHLNTFSVHNHEIITFARANSSQSGSELKYKVRVLTPNAESETDFHMPL